MLKVNVMDKNYKITRTRKFAKDLVPGELFADSLSSPFICEFISFEHFIKFKYRIINDPRLCNTVLNGDFYHPERSFYIVVPR